jgi:hypothetical protein
MGLIRRGGKWYARLRIGGRDVRKSLGTADEAEARRLYAELTGSSQATPISMAQRTTMARLVDDWLARKRVTSARKPRSIEACETYGAAHQDAVREARPQPGDGRPHPGVPGGDAR